MEDKSLKINIGGKNEIRIILLGPDGRNILGLARSLGEAGIKDIVAVTYGTKPIQVNHSKYVRKTFFVKNVEDGIDLIIDKLTDSNKQSFIFCSSDDAKTALDENYDRLKNHFKFGSCSKQSALKPWMDKKAQNDLAEQYGIRVPKSEIVKLGEMPSTIDFPIITKAIDSLSPGWKKNSFVCHNEDELREAYTHMKCTSILLQQFIEKAEEISLEGVMFEGKLYCFMQDTDYEFSPSCYGAYKYNTEVKHPYLLQPLEEMLNYIGYQGIMQTEFMIGKDGKAYYLETNFRHSGDSYSSTKFGANLPYFYLKSVMEGKPALDIIKTKDYPLYSIHELTDFVCNSGRRSMVVWLMRCLSADIHMLFNKNDLKPGIYTLCSRIKKKLKRILHL